MPRTLRVLSLAALLLLLLASASLPRFETGAKHAAAASSSSQAVDVPVTDNMLVTQNTKLRPGVYTFDDPEGDGVIRVAADNITLDATGVTLNSGDANFGGSGVIVRGRNGVTLRGGTVGGFRYGLRVENSSGVRVENANISGNYKDKTTCFLGIGDGDVYGGGIIFRNVSDSVVQNNTLYNQSTGLEMIDSRNNRVLNNKTSLGPAGNEAQQNSCWGIRLQGSTNNLVRGNVADYVNRERYPCTPQCQAAQICGACIAPATGTCLIPGDSAGILLVSGSHNNQVVSNSFTNSGDGFFLGNLFSRASNDNYVYGNDGSYAPANAFEATFSRGNVFENNEASNSNYGFWLGYSYGSRITRNNIVSNRTVGIEIEHGFENEIDYNVIWKNQFGVYLRADELCTNPVCDRRNPTDYCGRRCPSSDYSLHGNSIVNNRQRGLWVGGDSYDINAWHNNMICGGAPDQPCVFAAFNDMTRERGFMAARNWWNTTSPPAIAARIFDHNDDPSKGFVTSEPPLSGLIEAEVGPQVLAWGATAPLPVASSAPFERRAQQLVFHNNRVYVFGGRAGDQRLRNVYYGDLLPDGRVRAWTRTTDLPGDFHDHVVVRVGDHVFLLTGAAGSDAVYHNRITAGGALGPVWDLERARLPSRQSFAAAAFGDFIYVAGGNSGGLINNLRYIRVQPDGHLACTDPDPARCWLETAPLPIPMQGHSLVAYDGRLYVLAPNGRVFFGPLRGDGTLGAWGESPGLPRPLDSYSAFATDAKLYVLAGSGTPSVYFAQLNPNGPPDPWQTTLNLPPAALLAGARVGAYKDFLYTVGGFDGTAERNVVHFGQLEIPGGCRGGENLSIPLNAGPNGGRTALTYDGLATVTISGVGQASGRNYSDAFYVFANSNGTPTTPTHPNEFVLTINGQPAHNFMANRQPPGFRQDHRYTFRINAPPGPLTFGVGDGFPSDNTGGYRIGLCGGTPEAGSLKR